jgi:hypothetical protein
LKTPSREGNQQISELDSNAFSPLYRLAGMSQR